MSNSYGVITQITNEAMRIAHEVPSFVTTINREYDDSFAKKGAKIGSSLRIRKPDRYTVTTGSRVLDLQEQNEGYETVTVATQYHVDMYFTSDEMTMSLDQLSERKIKPAMSVLMSKVDSDVIQGCTKKVYNMAGTAGTALANSGSLSAFTGARAKINAGLAPTEDRSLQLDSVQMGAVTTGLYNIFNPQKDVAKAFQEGYYGRALGADWYENERILTHTVGSDVTGSTSTAAGVTNGSAAISLDTGSNALTVAVGDVFTVAGVFACHPETKANLGYLQQFTILTGTSGACTVSPTIYISGAQQNVCSSTGAALATTDFNGKTCTFVGTASSSYRQALMYHKDFATFVTADLPLFGGADKCQRLTQDGISLRVWQDGDIINDRMLMRIDILFGYEVIRPAWACRLIGSAVA